MWLICHVFRIFTMMMGDVRGKEKCLLLFCGCGIPKLGFSVYLFCAHNLVIMLNFITNVVMVLAMG